MAVKENVKQYLTTLAQTYGLDAQALLKKAEEDEAAAKLIDEGVMLRSDYSRKQDGLTAEFEKWKGEYYNKEVLPRWNEREELLKTLQSESSSFKAKSAAYEALYGTLDGFDKGAPPAKVAATETNWLDQKKYEQDIAVNRQIGALSGREFGRATALYLKEFGEVMDVDAFDKFVADGGYLNGQSVDTAPKAFRKAYEDFVRPKMEEKRTTQTQTDIARQVKEGVEAELAKRGANIPIDTAAPGYRHSAFFKQGDDAATKISDPATPAHVREDLLRQEFMKDVGNVTPAGLFTGG